MSCEPLAFKFYMDFSCIYFILMPVISVDFCSHYSGRWMVRLLMGLLVFSVLGSFWRCTVNKEGQWSPCKTVLTSQVCCRVKETPLRGLFSSRQIKIRKISCFALCPFRNGWIPQRTKSVGGWIWFTSSNLAPSFTSSSSTVDPWLCTTGNCTNFIELAFGATWQFEENKWSYCYAVEIVFTSNQSDDVCLKHDIWEIRLLFDREVHILNVSSVKNINICCVVLWNTGNSSTFQDLKLITQYSLSLTNIISVITHWRKVILCILVFIGYVR